LRGVARPQVAVQQGRLRAVIDEEGGEPFRQFLPLGAEAALHAARGGAA
jgi:hypothetical protein